VGGGAKSHDRLVLYKSFNTLCIEYDIRVRWKKIVKGGERYRVVVRRTMHEGVMDVRMLKSFLRETD
jgi:hypothetical protein